MHIRTRFPYDTTHEDVRIPLPDGTRLYATATPPYACTSTGTATEGMPGDEYDAAELADGVAVIHWLTEQEWCSSRVGMFGIWIPRSGSSRRSSRSRSASSSR
jgi:predicted acyl esterase